MILQKSINTVNNFHLECVNESLYKLYCIMVMLLQKSFSVIAETLNLEVMSREEKQQEQYDMLFSLQQLNTVYWESFMEENFCESPSLTSFVRKHSLHHAPILRSSDNQLHTICDLVLANRQLRRQLSSISIINRLRLINALANSHTKQAFLHSYPFMQPCMSRLYFSVFLPPQIITEKWYGTQDYTSLANSYQLCLILQFIATGLTPRRFSAKKYICYSIFGLVLPYSYIASFSVSIDLVWQPDCLNNMDGTISF